MARLEHRTLPLAALQDFEAAARCGSFAAAAVELGLTASAVSQQVKALEKHLGIKLFERRPQAISLTPAGRELLSALRGAFDFIQAALVKFTSPPTYRTITVAMPALFASGWFIPRMHRFRTNYPGFDIIPRNSGQILEPHVEGVDACVRHGRGGWPNVDSRFLFNEAIKPVCAPAYLAKHGEVSNEFSLERHQLLISEANPHVWRSWPFWPGNEEPLRRALTFGDDLLAVQAAINGMGIALVDCRLLSELLQTGQLVPFHSSEWITGAGWYLAFEQHHASDEEAIALLDWALSEVSAMKETSSLFEPK